MEGASGRVFDLTGRTALVTGATQGLGLAMAQALAQAGATVILAGRSQARLDAAAATCAEQGLQVRCAVLDGGDPASATTALAMVERDQAVDILVSNVGARLRQRIDAITPALYEDHLRTNVVAAYAMARACGRRMAERGWGRLILMSSMNAIRGRAGDVAYITAKGAIEAMVRALACEFGAAGVTCNALSPGPFATETNSALLTDPEVAAAIAGRSPLGRYGEPREMAGPCIFLASDASSYVNGHVLAVDGGYSIAL